MQPRRCLGTRIVAEAPVEIEEDLLRDVLRSRRVAEHAPGDRGDPRVLRGEEPVEARRRARRGPTGGTA